MLLREALNNEEIFIAPEHVTKITGALGVANAVAVYTIDGKSSIVNGTIKELVALRDKELSCPNDPLAGL